MTTHDESCYDAEEEGKARMGVREKIAEVIAAAERDQLKMEVARLRARKELARVKRQKSRAIKIGDEAITNLRTQLAAVSKERDELKLIVETVFKFIPMHQIGDAQRAVTAEIERRAAASPQPGGQP